MGITDGVREKLKMSVKTLASWSAHTRSTCLFYGLSEGVAGFCLYKRPDMFHSLKVAALAFKLSADVACNPWLLVGVCTYSHCVDDVIDALIESQLLMWCTPQCHRKSPGTYSNLC